MKDYTEWIHAFKLDPSKEISDQALEAICESGTDGLIVGGTDEVTLDNTLHLLARIRRYPVSCALEVSNLDAITPGFDHYFIPTVLNSTDVKWITGLHHRAVKDYGTMINWGELVTEGYCVLNKQSKVATVTSAETELSDDDVVAYAQMTENLFHLPIFYLEYSGVYGSPELVEKVKKTLTKTKLYYGGGIASEQQAKEMAAFADTIIVGNIIYEDLESALATVNVIK